VRHLLINENDEKKYAIDALRTFDSVKDLIDWHKVVSWWRSHLDAQGTNTPVKEKLLLRRGIERQEWQLNHEQIKLYEKVGAGAFGEVAARHLQQVLAGVPRCAHRGQQHHRSRHQDAQDWRR